MNTTSTTIPSLVPTGEATALLPVDGGRIKPITVIGNDAIRKTFDANCLQQAINARMAPGVEELILNPDAHVGYGAPVGCALVSPTHIYPGPVGVDIKCSMSLLQLDIPKEAIQDKKTRRALIDAIIQRTPTGAGKGQRSVQKAHRIDPLVARQAVIEGATKNVCEAMGIQTSWISRCEDSQHLGHNDTTDALAERLELLESTERFPRLNEKLAQLGSYGGGNHFGECSIVHLSGEDDISTVANTFGLLDGHVAFLSHCGSRGFGHHLASQQFKVLESKFDRWSIPYPANDRHLVYAPLESLEANNYLDDMALGGNFATINHLLINTLVLEAFQEILPGCTGSLVYFISHNIARKEILNNRYYWIHRKGATRAYPAKHYSLKDTPFYDTGHPILLPGDPQRGSAIMVAQPGAEMSCYSVNHGAGRLLGRRQACRTLQQHDVDQAFESHDILTNCRTYPLDEAPGSYKNFNDVIDSVQQADLARIVARLQARFVIKDNDKSLRGAA